VCVKFCKFFHGMTGKLKQLATEFFHSTALMHLDMSVTILL